MDWGGGHSYVVKTVIWFGRMRALLRSGCCSYACSSQVFRFGRMGILSLHVVLK